MVGRVCRSGLERFWIKDVDRSGKIECMFLDGFDNGVEMGVGSVRSVVVSGVDRF